MPRSNLPVSICLQSVSGYVFEETYPETHVNLAQTAPDDFRRFQPGDVLVTHTTTPIWTPLLNIASAAITEVGGPFSHAAIVAWEFGIPLANGALDATRVIADGMIVLVDGSAGIVEM